MHKFLEAVGFSELKKKDLEIIIKDIIDYPQMMRVTKDSDGNEFAELSKEFAPNLGIIVRGNYDEEDIFHMEYYYPYFYGTEVTTSIFLFSFLIAILGFEKLPSLSFV